MAYVKSVMNGIEGETSFQREKALDYYNHIPFFKSNVNKEYQKAKENGFKGTIEEYFSIRDYT